MTRALRTLFTAVAAFGLTATLAAQTTRLSEAERERLLPLAERLTTHTGELTRELTRAAGPTARNRFFRNLVAGLNNEAVAFRAALLRGRPIDVEAEVAELRDSLTQVQDRIHARRAPDANLRQFSASADSVLDQIERETASLGTGTGKAVARFEPGRYADVEDLDRLATELVEHSARLRDRMERSGRPAPATVHFDEQVRQLQRLISRRGVAFDHRPQVQRLQADLNASLRELRRAGADEQAMSEWEWADGLLERMAAVNRTGSGVARVVPQELLGLSHELHVQMIKAEELAKAAGRGGDAFNRLGDQAYALHHEMHDGRLSYMEAQDRVEAALRTFQRAEGELGPGSASAELRNHWVNVRATLEKMRSLMDVS